MKMNLAAMLCVSLLVIAACDTPTASADNRFEIACQDAVRKRLKSPASFQLARLTNVSVPITYSDHEKAVINARAKKLHDRRDAGTITSKEETELLSLVLKKDGILKTESGQGPWLLSAIVEYDAQNGFGALIRGIATCEYEASHGKFNEFADEDEIMVDGKTYTDWLINQASQ